MRKWILPSLLTTAVFMTACTSSTGYKNGKKFTFNNKETQSKLVYFCQNRPNLAPMSLRAQKAHAYFTQKNDENVQILVGSVGDETQKETAMIGFRKRAARLALKLHKKFSCTLVDSIEY